MELTRINNDINGNPRYVAHFFSFLNEAEQDEIRAKAKPLQYITDAYNLAAAKAKQIGGKKYKGKDFGGGIVLQSYNIADTINKIKLIKDNKY